LAEFNPTTLRFPPELRDRLLREASINGRSLSQEVIVRLRASLAGEAPPAGRMSANTEAAKLSDTQRLLLALFDSWPVERQLALLTVLKR